MNSVDEKLGEHTPVSSVAQEVSTAVEQEGSFGSASGVSDAHGGIENVPGYALPQAQVLSETAAVELHSLPDIAWASFGEPIDAEAVIGTDDRVQITNTGVYPWRVHASLRITAADGSQWIGTGWFLGPHTLGTAGHVVFIKNSGVPGRDGWVRSIQVMPGRNGNQLPYGSVTTSNFRSVLGWTRDGNQNYDYGAIILGSDLGSQTGWLGFGAYDDATITSSAANISGYPGDKPAGTQWYHGSRVTSVNTQKVFYETDSFGGQSGSAVYRIVGQDRMAFAVHTYGGSTSNSGTRINNEVFNNLVAWKA
ncbi:MAG: serine protease [Nocardiaceae bacterium]|nr:serine protease [Nocardiaceae bacterium]